MPLGVDIPVPQIIDKIDKIGEIVQNTPHEGVQNHAVEQTVAASGPQNGGFEGVVQTTPQDRVQNRTAERKVDIPVSQIIWKIGDVVQTATQEHVQQRMMDIPLCRASTPQKRKQNPKAKQTVDVSSVVSYRRDCAESDPEFRALMIRLRGGFSRPSCPVLECAHTRQKRDIGRARERESCDVLGKHSRRAVDSGTSRWQMATTEATRRGSGYAVVTRMEDTSGRRRSRRHAAAAKRDQSDREGRKTSTICLVSPELG